MEQYNSQSYQKKEQPTLDYQGKSDILLLEKIHRGNKIRQIREQIRLEQILLQSKITQK